MEPLIEPSDNGGDGAQDEHAFGEKAQTFAASSALFGDGDAPMKRGWGGEIHGGDHVHVCQAALAFNARSRCDKAFQTMYLAVQFIRAFGQVP